MCPKNHEKMDQIQVEDSDEEMSEDSSSQSTSEDSSDEEPEVEDEEEDETIKAIKRECSKKSNHPPMIKCEEFITDISFHPEEDILAVANIVGDVELYKYSNEENVLLQTLEVHTKSCRAIEFSGDGKVLFSTSKDKSVMISDVASGKLVRFYEKAHEVPVYCLAVLDENLFATGDDDGTIKLWDWRQRSDEPVYKTRKNEDFISAMITNEARKYLLCSSGDGSLTSIDLQARKIFMQSEEYEEEFSCLGLFRQETKVLAGSNTGKLFLYNWSEFGSHSDVFPATKCTINDMIPITENIVVTACEDGNLRATHLFPHRHLGIVGQHKMSAEHVDICNNGQFIASASDDEEIKFWNIEYFADFEKLSHKHKKHQKKSEMTNNLPSSKMKNPGDFFSGLA